MKLLYVALLVFIPPVLLVMIAFFRPSNSFQCDVFPPNYWSYASRYNFFIGSCGLLLLMLTLNVFSKLKYYKFIVASWLIAITCTNHKRLFHEPYADESFWKTYYREVEEVMNGEKHNIIFPSNPGRWPLRMTDKPKK
ncbi:hypothetical protein OAH12_02245 [Cyclobacteriaceae bacterium]|nr:hypothetical protein [Cyclobacteriaceae bacterium]